MGNKGSYYNCFNDTSDLAGNGELYLQTFIATLENKDFIALTHLKQFFRAKNVLPNINMEVEPEVNLTGMISPVE
jgi:hypothetical protein